MIVDIPTKDMVRRMVDDAVRKEMGRINQSLDKFRKRLNEIEMNVKK